MAGERDIQVNSPRPPEAQPIEQTIRAQLYTIVREVVSPSDVVRGSGVLFIHNAQKIGERLYESHLKSHMVLERLDPDVIQSKDELELTPDIFTKGLLRDPQRPEEPSEFERSTGIRLASTSDGIIYSAVKYPDPYSVPHLVDPSIAEEAHEKLKKGELELVGIVTKLDAGGGSNLYTPAGVEIISERRTRSGRRTDDLSTLEETAFGDSGDTRPESTKREELGAPGPVAEDTIQAESEAGANIVVLEPNVDFMGLVEAAGTEKVIETFIDAIQGGTGAPWTAFPASPEEGSAPSESTTNKPVRGGKRERIVLIERPEWLAFPKLRQILENDPTKIPSHLRGLINESLAEMDLNGVTVAPNANADTIPMKMRILELEYGEELDSLSIQREANVDNHKFNALRKSGLEFLRAQLPDERQKLYQDLNMYGPTVEEAPGQDVAEEKKRRNSNRSDT